ncbi:PREDICTED: uncharacterized protein LOC104753568 [Camelina sativa]|uniref:Uncharacterized protein LOC104753568 n=1 Tax=Camelina sativa TaxID=90675 RepID=A0ABM0WPC3_CAMSA|nr:PREDICTED: uncharacterized protein LOC104753568 [Camelina sativa]
MEPSKKFAEINQRIDSTYNYLNIKFESLNSKVKFMESNIASTSAPKPDQLPGKAIQNPREFTSKAIFVIEDDVTTVRNKMGRIFNKSHDRALDRVPDRVTGRVAPTESKPTKYISPAYKPPLPFIGRFKEQMIRKLKEKIEKQELMAIQHKVTVEEKKEDRRPALEQYEPYSLYKGMLLIISKQKAKNQAKKDLEDMGTAVIPTKLEDPGSFNLPYSLNYMHFNKCLCDLGAYVSVMPFSISQKLGYEEFKQSNLYISLVDGSRKDVMGKLESFLVKIGKARIPTYFIIIEMEQEPDDPMILGRPFLATSGAVIDVRKGITSLDIADGLTMRFDIKNATNQPTIGGQPFVIEGKAGDESLKKEMDYEAKVSNNEVAVQNFKTSVQELTDLVKDLQVKLNKKSVKKARPRLKIKNKQGSSVLTVLTKNKVHGDQIEPGGTSSPLWSPNQD